MQAGPRFPQRYAAPSQVQTVPARLHGVQSTSPPQRPQAGVGAVHGHSAAAGDPLRQQGEGAHCAWRCPFPCVPKCTSLTAACQVAIFAIEGENLLAMDPTGASDPYIQFHGVPDTLLR